MATENSKGIHEGDVDSLCCSGGNGGLLVCDSDDIGVLACDSDDNV